jgi:hypothetical protein
MALLRGVDYERKQMITFATYADMTSESTPLLQQVAMGVWWDCHQQCIAVAWSCCLQSISSTRMLSDRKYHNICVNSADRGIKSLRHDEYID